MAIRCFEDLIAWQRARLIVRHVYQHTNRRSFNCDYALRDQVRRSAISIMSNIAEGFHRWNRKDFLRFLQISIASSCETKSHYYVALDLGYVSEPDFQHVADRLDEVARLITALMRSLRKKEASIPRPPRTPH